MAVTKEEILFGYGVNAPRRSRLAKAVGKSEATLSRWARNADTIPLKDLKVLIRVRRLTDAEILNLMKGK